MRLKVAGLSFQNQPARGRLRGGHLEASSLRKLLKLVSEVSTVLNPKNKSTADAGLIALIRQTPS